jgi:hypothetical protein
MASFAMPHRGDTCHSTIRSKAAFGDTEILINARSRVSDADHWLQFAYQGRGRLCLMAALSLASNSRNFDRPSASERRLARIMVKKLSNGSIWKWLVFLTPRYRLMLFNDYSRTSHADVVALFDRAIHHLEAKSPLSHISWQVGV